MFLTVLLVAMNLVPCNFHTTHREVKLRQYAPTVADTNNQTNKQTNGQTDRQKDRQKDRQTDKQTNRQTDKHTDRQKDRQKNKQTNNADFARSRNASKYMSLHMNCQAAKGFNGYAMQHQTDSKYMYVLTHVCMGKLCSPRLNMVV